MKYTIGNLNQLAVVDNGWDDIKFNHLIVLDAITSAFLGRKIEILTDVDGDWFWVSPSLIINALPLLDIQERRVKDIINDLCKWHLLEKNPRNQSKKKMFLRTGENYSIYDPINTHKHYEKNCIVTMQKNSQSTMQKNSQYYTIKYNGYYDKVKKEVDFMDSLYKMGTIKQIQEAVEEIIEEYSSLSKDKTIRDFKDHLYRKVRQGLKKEKPTKEKPSGGSRAMSL